jgi:hypothetical protein
MKMERTTNAHLEYYVERINKLTGGDFCLGYAYGGVKLEANNGSVDISQRLTKGALYDQLVTMARALEHAGIGAK